MLIGLAGVARSGKDSVAGELVQRYGFTKVAFADPLREMALRLNPYVAPNVRLSDELRAHDGWEGAKQHCPEVRVLLQRLGTDAAREVLGHDIWVQALVRKVEPMIAVGRRVVISDVRFPNEVDAVQHLGGQTFRVERPGYLPANGHVSDTALEGFELPVIDNAGTLDELATHVEALMQRQTFQCMLF